MKIMIFVNTLAAGRHRRPAPAAALAAGETAVILCFVHSIFRTQARCGRRQKSGDWSMVRENISLGQRVEALTWLSRARHCASPMSPEGPLVLGVATGGGTRVGASTPLIAPPSLQRIPSSRRCVSAMPECQTSSANRAFGVAVTSRRRICSISEVTIATSGSSRTNNTPEKYVLTYLYLETIDTLGLLDVLTEDGDYGVFTFPTGDTDNNGNERFVSRDLLDSACELLFLERALQISRQPGLKVLDIGAGYGRLAYRAVTALSNIDTYFCIDAIPESTFISSYYLSRKGVVRPRVVAFDDQQDLVAGTIDLAVNIHSFSECAIEAVDYWVSRCAELKVEYLFIVPDISDGGRSRTAGQRYRFQSDTRTIWLPSVSCRTEVPEPRGTKIWSFPQVVLPLSRRLTSIFRAAWRSRLWPACGGDCGMRV